MKKIAIVGVEGSGKTVLMAAMGDKYQSPDANGVFLAPKSRATYAYCVKLAAALRAGKWPFATESGVLNLDWTLLRRQNPGSAPAELGQLSFLDFGGEIYRLAFGDGEEVELDEQRRQSVKLLKGHVRDADALIVLVNLSDIINGDVEDERTIEMNWLSQAIITYAFENGGNQNVALVFSQYDTYSDTIAQCGGLESALARYLPVVASRYGNRLSLFAVAAVDKTIPAPDGSGYPIPAPDFKPAGLEDLLQWMCNGVVEKNGGLPREPWPAGPSPKPAGDLSRKFWKAVSCVFKKFAAFSGRASRAEFWWMQLALFLMRLAACLIGGIVDGDTGEVLFFVIDVLLVLPGFACMVRRFHDRGMSSYWMLIPFTLLVVPFMPSKPGENEYGREPKPF